MRKFGRETCVRMRATRIRSKRDLTSDDRNKCGDASAIAAAVAGLRRFGEQAKTGGRGAGGGAFARDQVRAAGSGGEPSFRQAGFVGFDSRS